MLAKVKSEYRWNVLTAFSGVEFSKKEWRNVPAVFEDQASGHEWLETKDGNIPESVDENDQPLPRTDFPRSGMANEVAPIPPDLAGVRVEDASSDPRDYPRGGQPDVLAAEEESKPSKRTSRSKSK